jgi:hypothetical protein
MWLIGHERERHDIAWLDDVLCSLGFAPHRVGGVSRQSRNGDGLTPRSHSHRHLPVDSELAQSIHVLARAHQDAVWDRMQIANKLRSVLREFYPTFLAAFHELDSKEARAVLHLAPSPAQGQLVRKSSVAAALRRAGRTRGIPASVDVIHAALRNDQLRQHPQGRGSDGRESE